MDIEPGEIREAPLNQRYGRLLSCSLPCNGLSFPAFLAAG